MKLSIIIPFYNTPAYTDELLSVLDKQITENVEIILIDDGSTEPYKPDYSWLRVIRTKNGGQSKARNRGLKEAKGEYIQFIDSDDMVPEYFVAKLLEKIPEGADLIEYSWRSLNTNGAMFKFQVRNEGDRLSNPSACTRCFKRSFIGNHKFTEKKDACEDEDFTRHLGIKNAKTVVIADYMYFYRTDVEGSNTKRYKNGLCKTKRIVYFYDHISADQKELLKEVKKEDETNEVIVITRQNDLPELEMYCQILRPCNIWTHYLRGEKYIGCSIVPVPEQYDLVLYIGYLHVIGGIESFVYHFSQIMPNVTLLVGSIHVEQREKLSKVCKVVDYKQNNIYFCKNLVILRILDPIPTNIRYERSIRMCHGCRTNPNWHIKQDSDFIVNVSQVCKDSFGKEAENAMVIHNPIIKTNKRALILVSATRIPAPDKGNNEKRMRILADRMNEAGIPFVWFNFSDGQISNPPRGLVNIKCEMDIQAYIKSADFLVQLSDSEAWSYSILEALVNGTAVIVTPFKSAEEMGIKDGENGYIIPFDMDFDVKRLLEVPQFTYDYDNEKIKKEWEKVFNKPKPRKKGVQIKILTTYRDVELDRIVNAGEVITVSKERAKVIISAKYGEVI